MTIVTEIMQATVGPGGRSKRPPMWPLNQRIAGAAIAAVAAAAGCTASSSDVEPDRLRLFFPTGAAISPDGARLFVANANSDLTFDSGSVSVVPLASVEDVIGRWLGSRDIAADSCLDENDGDRDHACCHRDEDFTETLICDEDLFLSQTRDAGVRVGNFATDLALQDLGGGALRLIVPTRGDPSITWADFRPEAGRLSCNKSGKTFDLCDDAHRLSFAFNDADAPSIPTEPFAAFADSAGQFAMVTHLTSGAVTLIDSPRPVLVHDANNPGDPPIEVQLPVQVTDIQSNVFVPDVNNLRGATGIAGRAPRAAGDIVYVGSRSEDRIQTFTIGRNAALPEPGKVFEVQGGAEEYVRRYKNPVLLTGSFFFLDGVGNGSNINSGSNDTRSMAFSPSGDRLYLVNRKPPSLQIFDTSLGPTGVPRNALAGAVDICRQASTVTVVDSGDGERAYVTCFQDGQVYVVDPRGIGRVEDVITVGRGPYAAVAAPDGRRLYVTNFLEDTVAVIDLVPSSPTRNRVVLRIGELRPL